jgi:hypothetical protein
VYRLLLIAASFASSSLFASDAPIPARLEYNRDIRPILADTCFKCHGFDKNTREADLRLDVRDAAVADLGGYAAIVPGNPDKSELWKRISTDDEDDVMPPKKEHRQLAARDKEILRQWIQQGAEYQSHWAYLPPKKPTVPKTAKHPVDAFITARHAELGLKMSRPADRATLARRLSFDLLGLPPNPADVDAFVKDPSPNAYPRLVDKLLASPQFGERMAVWWLDLVRFADTIGYHSDNARNVWPYRDYVIRAFNENKRFDRFTVEQIAGDLLPKPTTETRVASAYNRLILSTEEGGAQAKQYEAKHVTDRVKSIGTTWLAQTFMCAECHDHKYDPVTAKDFYSLGAFFADIKEASIGKREDGMLVTQPKDDAKLKKFGAQIAAAQAKLAKPMPELEDAQLSWEKANVNGPADLPWTALKPIELRGNSKFTVREDATIKIEIADNPPVDTYRFTLPLTKGVTGLKLEVLPSQTLPKSGPGRNENGNFVLTEVILERDGKPLKISNASATFEQPEFPAKNAIDGKKAGSKNGWGILGNTGKESSLYLELSEELGADAPVTVSLIQVYGKNHTIGKLRLSATSAPKPIQSPNKAIPADVLAALKIERDKRNAEQKLKIQQHFRGLAPELASLRKEIADLQTARADFEKTLPRCLTSESTSSQRTVRILPRGDWMNDSGEVVQPATPHFLPASESIKGKALTRLDLAQWLVARENPLTARVFMNRLWKQFFGIGLSKTLEDIGTQGEVPANQPLLDYLAVEFQDRGWDVKSMVRLLVTSAAYQQSSNAPKDLVLRDPQNRELARQSRWRLDAEFVRDNALSIGGLLVQKIGGPSVKPYQPAGYWENLNFPTREWENDKGPNQWRRGLYTWWQRSYVHPAMLAFDASTREECAADRIRSNIPQQALVLLNDPEFIEAARAFAIRMLKEGGATPETRLAWAWKQATARAAKPEEIAPLRSLLEGHLTRFQQDPRAAEALLKVGQSPFPEKISAPDLAAYTSVARALLNLHETITRL